MLVSPTGTGLRPTSILRKPGERTSGRIGSRQSANPNAEFYPIAAPFQP